jgi:hypothetical protein
MRCNCIRENRAAASPEPVTGSRIKPAISGNFGLASDCRRLYPVGAAPPAYPRKADALRRRLIRSCKINRPPTAGVTGRAGESQPCGYPIGCHRKRTPAAAIVKGQMAGVARAMMAAVSMPVARVP